MFLDKFNEYYMKANSEKSRGNYISAKRAFYFSSKCLLKAAFICESDLKMTLLSEANKMTSYADSLNIESCGIENAITQVGRADTTFPKQKEDEEGIKFALAKISDACFDGAARLDDVEKAIRLGVINSIKHQKSHSHRKTHTFSNAVLSVVSNRRLRGKAYSFPALRTYKTNKKSRRMKFSLGLTGAGKTMIAKIKAQLKQLDSKIMNLETQGGTSNINNS